LQEIVFDELKETEVELQDIDTMACPTGVTALTGEVSFHGDKDFTVAIAEIDGFHGKVMWAFRKHSKYWAGATLFLHSDNISDNSWKKRNDLPHLLPHVEPEYIEELEQAISNYFYRKQSRGRNCMVEVFRRGVEQANH